MKYFAIFSSVICTCKSLQTCDFFPVPAEKCPDFEKLGALPKCSNARAGELCEGGGEFCTSNILDNCLENDVYIKGFPVKDYSHEWQVKRGTSCTIEDHNGYSSDSQRCVSVKCQETESEIEVKLPWYQTTITIAHAWAYSSFFIVINDTWTSWTEIKADLPKELRVRANGSIRIVPESAILKSLVLCTPLPTCGKGDILKDVNITECPSITSIQALPSCGDATFGSLCEADGECGTDPELDNCPGEYDVYRKQGSQGSQGSTRTILP